MTEEEFLPYVLDANVSSREAFVMVMGTMLARVFRGPPGIPDMPPSLRADIITLALALLDAGPGETEQAVARADARDPGRGATLRKVMAPSLSRKS